MTRWTPGPGRGEEGTRLERVIDGGCGVTRVGLGHEAFLDEGTDGGDIGVTEGRGLTDGTEDRRENLLDVERLDVGEDGVDGPVELLDYKHIRWHKPVRGGRGTDNGGIKRFSVKRGLHFNTGSGSLQSGRVRS